MAPLHVFAAHHPRSCSASSPFCVPDDVRGKILPSSDSHNCSSHKTSAKPGQNSPFQIIALRTLSFSVACKSFVCHSYESLMVIIVTLSFHALTNCKFHNSFLLIFMQNAGGVGGSHLSSQSSSLISPPVRSHHENCLREAKSGTKMQAHSSPWRVP